MGRKTVVTYSHALANYRRWLFVWLVLVLSFGTLSRAQVVQSFNPATGQLTVAWPSYSVDVYVRARKQADFPSGPIAADFIGTSSGAPAGTSSAVIPPGEVWMVSWFFSTGSGAANQVSGYSGPYSREGVNKVTVSLRNDRDVAVTYKLLQGSTVLGEVTLQPGQALIQQYSTNSTETVSVAELIPGIQQDGDAWRIVPGATTTRTVATVTPAPIPDPQNPPAPTPVTPAKDVPTNVSPNKSPTDKPIWTTTTANTNPAAQTDLLTNSTFREGIDKLYQLKKSETERQEAALKANPAAGAASAAGSSAGSQAASLYSSSSVSSPPSLSGPTGVPSLTVTFPASFGGKTFDFNPFTNDRFATICAWFRTATAWLAVVMLGVWVWTQVGEWTRSLAQVRQAQGNAVVGGTGAQATALIAAGAITVAVVACVTALLSWSFGEVGIAVIRSMTTTNPLATIPAGAYWMLDQVLPVSTLITCMLARVTFNMYAAPLFATCSAVVRFIVP